MQVHLDELARLRIEGRPKGVTSVCSAHPIVLRSTPARAATGKHHPDRSDL